MSFNYPGGCVIPINRKYFKSELGETKQHLKTFDSYENSDSNKNLDTLEINPKDMIMKKLVLGIVDFNSLYPNVMILHNLCQSTLCWNPLYKIQIGNEFYSPFDSKYFDIVAVPLKINKNMINIIGFITKSNIIVSETSKSLLLFIYSFQPGRVFN